MPGASLPFQAQAGGVVLHLRLTPKGGRDAIEGIFVGADGRSVLLARVRSAPENGAANDALLRLLAKTLGVGKSALKLVSGATARQKAILISGNPEDIRARLLVLCA